MAHPAFDWWCPNPTGTNRVYSNAFRDVFQRRRPRKPDTAVSRSRVGRAHREGISANSVDRGVVNDNPGTELHHFLDLVLHAQPHALQIAADCPIPIVLFYVCGHSAFAAAAPIVE